MAAEGADYEAENPAVAVASAVVLYLASKGGQASYDRDPSELIRLAVRARGTLTPRPTSPTGSETAGYDL